MGWERSVHGRPHAYVWVFFRLINGWAFESNGRKFRWYPRKHFGFVHAEYHDHWRNRVV
jgi:hypothetical protein